ncbi:hypothetical protein CHS0354_020518 [Potamilus streckersoni]|uniref:Uncharacterized protein n=1 Tax=Potamilus streckersoni TaxID=2493646 RepID=A0AAE0VVI9_9BIVA|nr:hypothetical protein CHS0354_020518 [Potamilus streckersoni]
MEMPFGETWCLCKRSSAHCKTHSTKEETVLVEHLEGWRGFWRVELIPWWLMWGLGGTTVGILLLSVRFAGDGGTSNLYKIYEGAILITRITVSPINPRHMSPAKLFTPCPHLHSLHECPELDCLHQCPKLNFTPVSPSKLSTPVSPMHYKLF